MDQIFLPIIFVEGYYLIEQAHLQFLDAGVLQKSTCHIKASVSLDETFLHVQYLSSFSP